MQRAATVLIAYIALRATLRDRVLYMLLGGGFVVLVLVPVFSIFSMRQVQELAITLSLSTISIILLLSAILLGASSVWLDVEERYTASVLGLPISRYSYILGKFLGVAVFLLLCSIFFGVVSFGVISFSASQYPSRYSVAWDAYSYAVFFTYCKYVLLAAVALLFSTISTSFFLPIFGTIAIYLAGSGAQEVMGFVRSDASLHFSELSKLLIKALYYLLPNFSAFDLHVYAIYSLSLPMSGLVYTFIYFIVYTTIIIWFAAWYFASRELM